MLEAVVMEFHHLVEAEAVVPVALEEMANQDQHQILMQVRVAQVFKFLLPDHLQIHNQ